MNFFFFHPEKKRSPKGESILSRNVGCSFVTPDQTQWPSRLLNVIGNVHGSTRCDSNELLKSHKYQKSSVFTMGRWWRSCDPSETYRIFCICCVLIRFISSFSLFAFELNDAFNCDNSSFDPCNCCNKSMIRVSKD